MAFTSILFAEDNLKAETMEAPDFFIDLNLDQIIETITAGSQNYDLKPFFYAPLYNVDSIRYRHEVMQDLENTVLYENMESFAYSMRSVHDHLAQADKLYYKYQKEAWFLDAVDVYCQAVDGLMKDLFNVELKSRGFLAFREYVAGYVQSNEFKALVTETQNIKEDLSSVRYCLLIKDNCIKVRGYESETDYSADVQETFARFKMGTGKYYGVTFASRTEMNHIEAGILDLVAKLYPDVFQKLDNFYTDNGNFIDKTIAVFEREIQFYIAYLKYMALFTRMGLKFCYPQISDTSKEIYDYAGFDLALAYKLLTENKPVVCNDFYLQDQERIFIVSGPNQGGKTTFARTFGQLHYLAGLGCPVPGSEAQLFLFDQLFTHFEREEDIKNLRGKLQDDLVRINRILNQATPNSIIIMNEIFTSTTLKDAVFLGKKIIEKILALDILCVCVTFIDELTSFQGRTVSMVSTIVPQNPALRTYKIVRQPADGLSYAISIAEKYRLTYDCLKERIK